MKTLILALFLLPCGLAAQAVYPAASSTVLCRINTPIGNTGSTTTNYLTNSACKIPGGTLGPNSVVQIIAQIRDANPSSGTCSVAAGLYTTSGATFASANSSISGIATTANTTPWAHIDAEIVNAGSLSSQNGGSGGVGPSNGGGGFAATTINTA